MVSSTGVPVAVSHNRIVASALPDARRRPSALNATLLTASVWLLRRFGLSRGMSIAVAVVATSLLFSAAHYFGPYGERIDLFGFSFRFVAGLFFCALFVYRGFGIAAGAHAGYDILIGVLP